MINISFIKFLQPIIANKEPIDTPCSTGIFQQGKEAYKLPVPT
jgi:hypothetical protein